MTFTDENQIAEFRSSVYKDEYGFHVSVFKLDNGELQVDSDSLLEDTYSSFEEFLDDLVVQNPLWHTYYLVRVKPEYEQLVKNKLRDTIEKALNNLSHAVFNSECNWVLSDNEPLGDFVKYIIQTKINENNNFSFLSQAETIEDTEPRVLEQMWNGYCPESWLKGHTVRMRLNKSDFFESEATGLQIAIFPGVQAIILNFRGNGNFRATPTYADEVENGELLSPQNVDRPPFNNPTEVFTSSKQIEDYIAQIK